MTEPQASYCHTHMVRVSTTDNVAECGLMLYNKPSTTRWSAVTCEACLERQPAPADAPTLLHHRDATRLLPTATCGAPLTGDACLTTAWEQTTCVTCLEEYQPPQPELAPLERSAQVRVFANHPDHYRTDTGDLYAAFIAEYGLEIWCRHVEMECIQYLHRARKKGQYREDIDKVRVICERILAETSVEEMRREPA